MSFILKSKKGILFFLGICALTSVSAQKQVQKEPVTLSSPYETMYNFLYYLDPENYDAQKSSLSFYSHNGERKKSVVAAKKLKYILDGKGLFIDLEMLPKNNNYYDSALSRQIYFIAPSYPGFYIVKQGENWVFPKEVLKRIEVVFSEVFPPWSYRLFEYFPHSSSIKVFGLTYWQIATLLILILLAYILFKGLFLVVRFFTVTTLKRLDFQSFAKINIKKTITPITFTLLFAFISFVLPFFQLPVLFTKYLTLFLKISIAVFLILLSLSIVNIITVRLKRITAKTKGKTDDQLIPILKTFLNALVFVGGIISILNILSIPIVPLLTGLSIGGLAFALAAQDTIKNFFGTVMIFIDKPFLVGDWITCGDTDGSVESVGFRGTRIRTFRNSVIYVPNAILTNSPVDNHGLRVSRRYYTTLGIAYETSHENIQKFLEGLKSIVREHKAMEYKNSHIYFHGYGASSLEIMFYTFIRADDWGKELSVREEINLSIISLARELGVDFAYPTQTLYMHNAPENKITNPTL